MRVSVLLAPHGGERVAVQVKETHPPIYLRPLVHLDVSTLVHLDASHDLRLLVRLDAPPVRPPMTRARLSGRTPNLSSASAVPSPAIRSIISFMVMGGTAASASPISSSCAIGSRRLPPGMQEPISRARCGRTASLSWSPQKDFHRTCLPGASYSSERAESQPGTGQFARHCPLRSRRPSRASDQ